MAPNEEFTPYAWEELVLRWERGEITLEQLGGQLLVWSQQLHTMLAACQREQENLGHSLAAHEVRLQALEKRFPR